MHKILVVILSVFVIAGCGGGAGGGALPGGTGSTISGANLSALWRFARVECYTSGLSLTSMYTLAAGDSVSDWLVVGNNTTSTIVNTSSCRTEISRSYTFTPTGSLGSVSYGTFSGSSGSANITTGQGSCSYTFSLSKVSGGNITPTSLSISYTNGQFLSAGTGEYVYFPSLSPRALAIPSIIQVVGSPSDVCFLVYESVT
jgi:hypothetical protein